ncbi:MAG: TolC family protein [Mucilaginibacter sp.]
MLGSYCNLHAQDSTLIGKSVIWDLAKCISYAKDNNIQINSLRLTQKTSQQELLLAKAAKMPDLTGAASQDFGHANNKASNGSRSSGMYASGSYGLSSNVTLYNGNIINNNISQKNLAIESANLNIIQTENDITLQVTQIYLTILLDKETIIYDEDLVAVSTAQVKQAQQKYDVGSIARKDLIQLQAQLSTDKYTLIAAQNQERQDLLTLKQLLILPGDASFDITKPDTVIAKQPITPLHEVEQAALQNRPEIKNGQIGVQVAQYDVLKARAGYKPTLTAGGSLATGYTTGNGAFYNQFNSNFTQQLGLNLSVPIFTKRVVKTQVEEAKIGVDQAALTLRNSKLVLSQTVERAYLSVMNAQSQYDAALEGYKYNQEGYRIVNEQLKVGVANIVDFLLQKNLFIQSRQQFVQAKYNALLTSKIYDFYKGVPIKL